MKGSVADDGSVSAQDDAEDAGLAPGSALGRYTVVRRIGAGGMGAVYEATHADLGKRVAIKTLHGAVAGQHEVRRRFLREGQIASRIRHPHVVDVTDVGAHEGAPYLVMEYLEGEDLAAVIEREGALPVARIAEVMLPVLSAVAAAHDAGIVHRDLKPENIFLARGPAGTPHPKVLDFGISKALDPARVSMALTGTAALLGTPYYMSPEQAQGARDVDAGTDQFALGVVLYECATARLPFDGPSLLAVLRAIADARFEPPRRLRPELPEAFEAVVLRAMALRPEDRFASVRALALALAPFAAPTVRAAWEPAFGGAAERATSPSAPPPAVAFERTVPRGDTPLPADREARRGRAAVLGVGALLALAAGLAAVALRPTPTGSAPTASRAPVAPPTARAATYTVAVAARPATAAIALDGAPAGVGALHRELARDGAEHTLRVTAEGHRPATVTFRDAPPPAVIALDPEPAAPATPAATDRRPERGARRGQRHGAPVPVPVPGPEPTAPAEPSPRTTTNQAPIVY